jgi:hypothetical protein
MIEKSNLKATVIGCEKTVLFYSPNYPRLFNINAFLDEAPKINISNPMIDNSTLKMVNHYRVGLKVHNISRITLKKFIKPKKINADNSIRLTGSYR